MTEIKSIAVYAASSSQVPQPFFEAAGALGAQMAAKGIRLVYGAGKVGLMGALADACLGGGGTVTGVIPQFMVDNGWCRDGLTELVVTPDMHVRKETIVSMGDATIALPGGCGTLEELLEMFDRAIGNRFMRPVHRSLWSVAATPEEALQLAETTPPWDTGISKMAQI